MVNITINNIPVTVEDGITIMEACKEAKMPVPSLCYLKGINEIGACRVCVVEIEGIDQLVAACNNTVLEGMVVRTNSPKVRVARRMNMELLLATHDSECTSCVRSGNCTLQSLAADLGITELPYEKRLMHDPWDKSFPLIRNNDKCVNCLRCIQVCEKIQTLGIWDLAGTGGRTTIDVSGNRVIKDSDCALCGQCITHCPVGGLRERDDTQRAFDALADPDKITVVQVAPAVRTAWGEYFGMPREQATIERMAAVLRRLGFDYVFDTNFSADLTIMEEGTEFLHRLKVGGLERWPMFTSCCPGWVRFLKSQYPELTGQLSTAKSPQQMFGSVTKSWFAQKLGVAPEKIFCVSIMPCVAKKAECELPTMRTQAGPDVDLVLTTREFVRMIRADKLNPMELPEEELDSPLGAYTGAGAIFGATGGVMEAALRTAAYLVNGENPDPDAFAAVRTGPGLREAEYELGGSKIRCAVVSGLGNARKLIQDLKAGRSKYDFVEVMACPGGCVGGGGQPVSVEDEELYGVRGERLYDIDRACKLRFSHENPEVQQLYREFLGEPLSHRSEELLHTDHRAWDMPK